MNEKIFNQEMEDTELEEVVGGTGLQCMGILYQLKNLGFKIKTPLVAGNESEAADELKQIIKDLSTKESAKGSRKNLVGMIYDDDRPNVYLISGYRANPRILSEDEFVDYIKQNI